MDILHSEAALGVRPKSRTFHQPRLRNSWSSEYDSKYALPPKHPDNRHFNPKQVGCWDTDSTDTQSSFEFRNSYSRNSWSCEYDAKDQLFFVTPNFQEIPRSPKTTTKTWDPDRSSQSSKYSASCESDAKEISSPPKFPGVHRSYKTKQRVVSWEIDLMNDVKSALNDLKIDLASPRSSCGESVNKEVFVNGEFPVIRHSTDLKNSPPARNFEDCESYSKEVVVAAPNFFKSRQFPDFRQLKPTPRESGQRGNLNDGDVRRIVDGILKELRPPRPERSISCSSSCSGCCSCCYGSCSNFGTWTPRPSTPAVDIPKIRQKPAVLARIHGPRNGSPRESSCSCAQCIMFKIPTKFPSFSSSSSWMTNSFCSKCLPPFDNDSLDSKISIDSLNHQSIFSLDSLNSLTDPDSLEYSKTNISIDSLDSLDSCCNYDSLSDSKDSGFFSCSLPVVC